MSTPITPTEAELQQEGQLPAGVFEVFNTLIVKALCNGKAIVYQDEVIAQLIALGYNRDAIFENKWLDVERYYRAVGWSVQYDRPAYNETYRAYFTFSVKHGKD